MRSRCDTHNIPVQDPYSYTREGQAWFDNDWLTQRLFFTAWKQLGAQGLIFVKYLVLSLALCFFILTSWRPHRSPFFYVPFFLAMLIGAERYMVRPEIFTLLFVSVYLFLLQNYLEKKSRWILLLPLLQAAWTNCHGGFPLGILLTGLCLTGLTLERHIPFFRSPKGPGEAKGGVFLLMLVLLGTIVGSFMNPHGWRIWLNPLHQVTSSVYGSFVTEWFAPSLHMHGFMGEVNGWVLAFLAFTLFVLAGRWRGQDI